MLPDGLIGFMLPQVFEVGFYADPPKNKLGDQLTPWDTSCTRDNRMNRYSPPLAVEKKMS
jgi:hypothetical protein